MNFAKARYLVPALLVCMMAPGSVDAESISAMRSAVVKIYVTMQHEDYSMPWQGGEPGGGTGSGFIISKKRILTNAHVVSDAKFIEVQKANDSRRYKANVTFIAHDCDLAILNIDDPDFFAGTRPVKFANAMPSPDDEVTVLGYPLGGDRISVTRGVVSRIDYSVYTHSEVDQHLVLQVDAAINPGNSGGPVLFNGKVVGLAFQGLMMAENIGYAIPLPVINHFLQDIDDNVYNGYPELGVEFMPIRNDALRRDLKLPADKAGLGIVIYFVDPFGSAKGLLRIRDVLLAIDSSPIADDATITLNDTQVLFAELLERKQWGQAVTFKVWRDNAEIEIKVPLTNPEDPFVYRNIYDTRPDYYVVGGLVFSPLSREYLRTLGKNVGGMNSQQLLYYSEYAKTDDLYKDHDEFVALITRLPHPVNTYSDSFLNGIVTEINGVQIRNLKDVKKAVEGQTEKFHLFHFAGMKDMLIMDAKAAKRAEPQIFSRYRLFSREYFGVKK
jgi:S1-C subfamily serine protease